MKKVQPEKRPNGFRSPSRYWPWYVAGTTLAIAVLPILPQPYSSAEVLVGAVGGLWALAFYMQSRHAEDARFLRELLTEFNKRYDRMNNGLQRAVWRKESFSDRDRARFIDYFNLCAEEWLFWRAGYICEAVWVSWENGMKQYAKDDRVRTLWLEERESNSYYGFELPVNAA